MSLATFANNCCPTEFADGTTGQVITMSGGGPAWTGASGIAIADAGGFFAVDDVESALQQIAAQISCEAIQDCVGTMVSTASPSTNGLIYNDAAGTLAVDCEFVQDCIGAAVSATSGITYSDAASLFSINVQTSPGIQGVGTAADPIRTNFDSLPVDTTGVNDFVVSTTANPDGSIITPADAIVTLAAAATAAGACVIPAAVIGSDGLSHTALHPVSDQSAARPALPIAALISSAANADTANGIQFRDSNDLTWTVAANLAGCGAYVQAARRQIAVRLDGNVALVMAPASLLVPSYTAAGIQVNFPVVNTAIGAVTVPVTGIYRVSAQAFFNPAYSIASQEGPEMYIQVNGAFVTSGQIGQWKNLTAATVNGTVAFTHVTGTQLSSLNAGDVVRIIYGNSDPANPLLIGNRSLALEYV